MASPKTQRKLTAILCADVVGYSRLMRDDEEATLETLTAYREVFTSSILEFRGRVVDAKGDALLAEFPAVTDAVNCAVDIQRELAERNTELTDSRRMDFRIGINLSEVMVKGEEIYGDGVNIAARLEALAEPGGTCISRSVYDQVKNKLKLDYEYLGEQEVKNIAEPVRAYRVLTKPGDAAPRVVEAKQEPSEEKPALALPDYPSIAVLAFDNMSADPEQEYFSDGITEDIITDLSKISGLFVIARTASFSYKGRVVSPRQMGQELGVRYLLEGSVRRVGERARITAQLIEAESGKHLWAERYDRTLEDVFAVQDEITSEIVTALDVQLVSGEQARIWRKSLRNPQARDAYYRATAAFLKLRKDTAEESLQLYRQVVELEPDSPVGYTGLAWVTWQVAYHWWNTDIDTWAGDALNLAEQAIALDDLHASAWCVSGHAKLLLRQFEGAEKDCKRATTLAPSAAMIIGLYALFLIHVEKYREAIATVEKAHRLSPTYQPWTDAIVGAAYLQLGQPENAIRLLEAVVTHMPQFVKGRCMLAASYVASEQMKKARTQAKEILAVDPEFRLETLLAHTPFENAETSMRYKQKLQLAGLPE